MNEGSVEGRVPRAEGKPWWASKTIIGSIAAIGATVLGFVFKAEIPQEDLFEFLTGLAAVVGSGLAIYGRITAKTEIRKAERATPEEIARARRGGSFKGGALVRLLCLIGFTLFTLAMAFYMVGCARYDHPANASRQSILSLKGSVERSREAAKNAVEDGQPERIPEFLASAQREEDLAALQKVKVYKMDCTPKLLECERIQLGVVGAAAVPINLLFGIVTWPVALVASPEIGPVWPFLIMQETAKGFSREASEIQWLESAVSQ